MPTVTPQRALPPNLKSTPFRFVVATDWVRPAILVAAAATLSEHCGQRGDVELVIATPSDPQHTDAERAKAVVAGIGAQLQTCSVVLESFREAIGKPHDAAVVSAGDIDHLMKQVFDFGGRCAEVGLHLKTGAPLTRPRNSGQPAVLEAVLNGFANVDTVADHQSTQLAFRAARPPYQGTYLGENRCLVRTSWFASLYCPADELTRTPRLLLDGCVDPARLMYLQSAVHQGGTALHLGAGIGDETTFLAFRVGQQGRVVAVEGSPDDFAFLARNISLGRYEGIVATVPAQADLADGHAALDAAPGWYGPHLGNPWTHLQHRPTGVVRSEAPQVPTVNTTQLVNDLGAVDLVLISETHRFGRLLGAIESPLLSGCVGGLLASCSPAANPTDWCLAEQTLRRLVSSGWRLSVLDENGTPRELPLKVLTSHHGHLNVVLQPASTST